MNRLWWVAVAWAAVLSAAGQAACGASAPPCAQCDAVAARDVGRLREALEGGARAERLAWELALNHLSNGEREGRDLVTLLAQRGADPNLTWTSPGSARRGSTRDTSLIYAAAVVAMNIPTTDVIDVLIANGLDITGGPGTAALAGAVAVSHTAVVERLLAAGVPVNPATGDESPLSIAIQTRHLPTIAVLEKAGALEW